VWQPMDAYPLDPDRSTGCNWGPEVLVLMATDHGPVRLVAHLEADMWLARAAEDHVSWSELERAPSYWCPLPDVIKDVHTERGMICGMKS
jgi:hypothetical protein